MHHDADVTSFVKHHMQANASSPCAGVYCNITRYDTPLKAYVAGSGLSGDEGKW